MDFIDKLDDTRFGQFKVDLENDLLKGMEYPETLENAHRRASNYKRLEFKHSGGGSEAVFAAKSTKQPRSPRRDQGRKGAKRSNNA